MTARRFQGDWFFTGDKYRSDADGLFWYAGRADDVFRVSGEWLSPAEVEAALIEHPAVLESAAVPYEDDDGLLKPQAIVVLKNGWSAREDLARELEPFVKQRISPSKYPRRISLHSGASQNSQRENPALQAARLVSGMWSGRHCPGATQHLC
ncbi:MAG: AMP-binding enzyme [Gammaproteobacteria bacterium]